MRRSDVEAAAACRSEAFEGARQRVATLLRRLLFRTSHVVFVAFIAIAADLCYATDGHKASDEAARRRSASGEQYRDQLKPRGARSPHERSHVWSGSESVLY